jgi:putative tryptophan/tyrosine transport system substrate-binding protein
MTEGTPAAIAAREGTSTIPIVMAVIGDPIAAGVVSSVARPGGNITGSTSMTPEIDAKRLELLKELVPGAFRIAVLWNPANPNNRARIPTMQAAAKSLRLTLEPLVGVGDSEQLEKGFGAIVAARSQALIMESDLALLSRRERIVDFATKRRLPGLYAYREFVEIGGLASYAPSYPAMFRRAAVYVDKILKGAKPGELPIEQPTKFDLLINLRAAKAIGLTIPQSLLGRADEIIQ